MSGFVDEDQVRRIKEAVDLVGLMGEYTQVKRAGAHHVACCPFHAERSPSLQIYDDGHYHCYGCGAHGDAIALIRDRERCEFVDAVELLARRVGIEVKITQAAGVEARPPGERAQLLAAVEMAVRFYESSLWGGASAAAARSYLVDQRGLTEACCRQFRLGWAPGRDALLDHARLSGFAPEILGKADLAVQRDGHWRDRFFDRITWPICDRHGQPIAFSARVLPDVERRAQDAGNKVAKYVNSSETPLYRKGAVVYNLHRARGFARDRGRVLVVEAQTGVMACDQADVGEAVAVLGTALTLDQAKAIGTAADRVVLCFDGDRAGQANARKAVGTFLAAGVSTAVALLPDDQDPAEMLAESPDRAAGRAAFDAAIDGAVDDIDYLLIALAPTPAEMSNARLLQAQDELIAVLAPVPDDDLRDLHLGSAAKHLRVAASKLRNRAAPMVAALHSRSSDTRGSGNGAADDNAQAGEDDATPHLGLDDQGNAERFVLRNGRDARFCFNHKAWYLWTGTHWKLDLTEQVKRLVVETVNVVLGQEAAALRAAGRDRAALRVERWQQTSRNERKISAVLAVAQKETGIGVLAEQLNTHDWLLTCDSGTIDLTTGQLREAAREDLITKCIPIKFLPDFRLPRIDSHFDHLCSHDADLVDYLGRCVGYTMSGDTGEEALFLVHGKARSGKSTLITAIERVLGDYSATLEFEIFLTSRAGSRETYFAAIDGARMVACSEVGAGKEFAAEIVKKATGNDRLQARILYSQPYWFTPRYKLWLVCNDPPRVSDTDGGFWARMHVIACNNTLPPDQRDKGFKPWLRHDREAGEALLAWCVRGAVAYRARGLAKPKAVVDAIASYHASQDPLQEYLDERTWWDLGGTPQPLAIIQDLRNDYEAWCQENNLKPLSTHSIRRRLSARGAIRGKTGTARLHAPVACWRGFRLRDGRDLDKPGNAPRASALDGGTDLQSKTVADYVTTPVPPIEGNGGPIFPNIPLHVRARTDTPDSQKGLGSSISSHQEKEVSEEKIGPPFPQPGSTGLATNDGRQETLDDIPDSFL